MRERPAPFNPFIVLSDVTISVIVILVVLLMLFTSLLSGQLGLSRAELKDKEGKLRTYQEKYDPREAVLKKIGLTQDEFVKATASSKWGNTTTPVLRSKGPQRMLFRFPNSRQQFTGTDQLSPVGRAQFQKFAELIQPLLTHYQDWPEKEATLLEVQIQGHAVGANAFDRSLRRAKLVRDVLAGQPRFPGHLLSVAAYGAYRPAYESSESLGKVRYILEKRGVKAGEPRKQLYTERIDVILVFAGQTSENDYVRSVESGGAPHGPLNDVSDPKVRANELEDGYQRARQGEAP